MAHDLEDIVKVIERIKARARVLHRRAVQGDGSVVERFRTLPPFRGAPAGEVQLGVRRHHGLTLVARELGFDGWPALSALLTGERPPDFGTLLYPESCGAHWNVWSADYEEARSIRDAHGGYLLAYRRQFFIAEASYVDELGLDPADPDWQRAGRDWVRPADVRARARLAARLVDARLPYGA